ncbi:MAG: hypothetical protein A2Y12_13065 [Planctomycetes bacterium GWF2_42_9]|nr:MAG: hypothetical protein A2Y12_13065 [Planctomycetes bacterium GWF2_42_9]
MSVLTETRYGNRRGSGCDLVKSHVLTKFKAGDKLPTEEELSRMVGTTRYAATRALTELSAEKLVQRRPGLGTIMASSMSNGKAERNGTEIAFMADEFESYMNAEIMRGIDARCREKGLRISLLNSDYSCKEEEKHLKSLASCGYNGAIARIGEHNENFKILEESVPPDYPLVLVDRQDKSANFPCIGVNNEKAAYEAVKYLIQLGHKKIAYITYDETDRGVWGELRRRELGYRKALTESGIEVVESYIQGGKHLGPNAKPTEWYFDSLGYEPMSRLLLQKERPTAVFLFHCYFAAGAFRAIRDHGLKVPDDISVISMDDAPVARYAPVPLTVMAQPLREMGSKAVDKLVERVEGKIQLNENILLDGTLIVRESTARVK